MKFPADIVTLTLLEGTGFTDHDNLIEIKFKNAAQTSSTISDPNPHFFESFIFDCANCDQDDKVTFTVYSKASNGNWDMWAQEGIPLRSLRANHGRAQAYILKPAGERLRARKADQDEYSVYDCEVTLMAYFPPKKGEKRLSAQL